MFVTDRPDSPTAREVLWRFGPMVYAPTVLFAVGEGAVLPLIPILSARLGADVALSALIASLLVIGQLLGNIPAGWAVARFGERATMIAAGLLALVSTAIGAFAPVLALFALAVFILGFCAAAFGLARHSFMTTRVPIVFRARALSLLGGTFRFGMFTGPFIAAALIGLSGDERSTIWFLAVCLVALLVLVTFGPDPEKQFASPAPPTRPVDLVADAGEPVPGAIAAPLPPPRRVGVFRTMWQHRTVLSRVGLAAACLSAVRSARQVVLPLWGVSIGLDAQTIALVVGVSGAVDFALFYASGQVMDRFGRLWAALPAMVLMGSGFLALSVTHDVMNAEMWFALFAAVLGVGNGLSSGILLTIGADLAPRDDPAPFLGSWRTLTDAGGATTPLIVSGLTAVASLSVAAGAVGVVGLLGAVAFIRWLPRFVPHSRP
ncbi:MULTISPECIES: MFS transporter [unclassified Microbacterium]|uniref:MFS transporter n=1 Tax=unclassified Microbacterium TaxID=2609290 RepID=UPI0038650E0A